ncbi:MAG: hypothetical protein K8I82_02335 [Anaerolineae bacterium]|nr:hypothetical protein [Anaerolineae bacterium]
MDANTIYLRNLVKKAAAIYSQDSRVKAIMLTGSASLGMVDTLSDTDTIIYYDTLPSEEEIVAQRERLQDSPGDWYGKDPEEGYAEYYFIEGVKCDFGHVKIESWEKVLTDVLDKYDTDTIKQKMMGGMVDSIPLYGHDLIESWKSRARAYPDELARNMVQTHLRFRPLWIVRDMADGRGDLLWFYEELVTWQKNILGILLGLNRLYHPHDFKHMDWMIEQMTHTPKNLSSRLKSALRADPLTGVHDMSQLIDETMGFIDKHMPDVDTSDKRQRFHRAAMRWSFSNQDDTA